MTINNVKFGGIDLAIAKSITLDGNKKVKEIKLNSNIIWPLGINVEIYDSNGNVYSKGNPLYINANTSYIYVNYDDKYQSRIDSVSYNIVKEDGTNITSTVLEDMYPTSGQLHQLTFSLSSSGINSLSEGTKLTFTVIPYDINDNIINELNTVFYCIIGTNTENPDIPEDEPTEIERFEILADGYAQMTEDPYDEGALLDYNITFYYYGYNINDTLITQDYYSVSGIDIEG